MALPKRLAAACVLTALVGASPVLGAQDIATLEERVAEAREQAEALAVQIDAGEDAIAEAQAAAAIAAQHAAELSVVIEDGRRREAKLEGQVADAAERLTETRARFHRSQDALADRLVAIYKGGMPDATTVLLEADGLDDMATRAEYLEAIEEADAALVSRVRELREQVEDDLAALSDAETAVEAHVDQVEAAHAEVSAAQAAAEQQVAEYTAIVGEQQALADTLASKVEEWKAQIVKLEKVSEQEAQAQIAGWFGDWAIPAAIVMCESGGNYEAVNSSSGAGGAYQIMPETWELYGGEGDPEDASPAEQDAIAAQIWADSGPAAWVCAG